MKLTKCLLLVLSLTGPHSSLGSDPKSDAQRLVHQKVVPQLMKVCLAVFRDWSSENPQAKLSSSRQKTIVMACVQRTLVPVLKCAAETSKNLESQDSQEQIKKCIANTKNGVMKSIETLAQIAASGDSEKLNQTTRAWVNEDREKLQKMLQSLNEPPR